MGARHRYCQSPKSLLTSELNRRRNGCRGASIRGRRVPCTIEGERGVQLDTAPRADILLPDSVRRVGDVVSGHWIAESVVDGHVEQSTESWAQYEAQQGDQEESAHSRTTSSRTRRFLWSSLERPSKHALMRHRRARPCRCRGAEAKKYSAKDIRIEIRQPE